MTYPSTGFHDIALPPKCWVLHCDLHLQRDRKTCTRTLIEKLGYLCRYAHTDCIVASLHRCDVYCAGTYPTIPPRHRCLYYLTSPTWMTEIKGTLPFDLGKVEKRCWKRVASPCWVPLLEKGSVPLFYILCVSALRWRWCRQLAIIDVDARNSITPSIVDSRTKTNFAKDTRACFADL